MPAVDDGDLPAAVADEDGVTRVRVTSDPGPDLLAGVDTLLERAAATDPSPALNEAALLALRHPDRGHTRHLVAAAAGKSVGYAQLADDGTGQLVVDPPVRRHGVGRLLMEALLDQARRRDVQLRVWAQGDSPAARALAARTGLVPARTLLIMQRPLSDLPDPVVPEGVTIAPFRVGVDEQAWLTVNARAFAHHPEQGSIDAEDLAERMGEAWFDPAGFFLARGSASAGEWNPPEGVGGRPPSGQGSASASEWNPPEGVGGRPPSGQGSASASEWNPPEGVGGRPPSGQGSASASEWNPPEGVGGRPPSGQGSASASEWNPPEGVGGRPPSGQGSASASEWNPPGGVGGRPPSGQGSASASEWNPPGGVGGRPPSGQSAEGPDGRVLGFHWTKEHGDGLGEVYVLGVDPDAQGRGLAKSLLLTGLAHLRDRGDTEVELYVEADEARPVGLYRSYGFSEASRDVMYAGPGTSPTHSAP